MSPELHDRAVGAERTCAGAEILDLIARVGERRIADFTAPEIFLTEAQAELLANHTASPANASVASRNSAD